MEAARCPGICIAAFRMAGITLNENVPSGDHAAHFRYDEGIFKPIFSHFSYSQPSMHLEVYKGEHDGDGNT